MSQRAPKSIRSTQVASVKSQRPIQITIVHARLNLARCCKLATSIKTGVPTQALASSSHFQVNKPDRRAPRAPFSSGAPLPELEIYERMFTRLVRTYLAGMEGLKFYRSGNNPGVTVQNVSVRDRGQAAVVGKITQHGRPAPDTIPASPLATADEKIAPMPLVSKPEPEPVAARHKREQ